MGAPSDRDDDGLRAPVRGAALVYRWLELPDRASSLPAALARALSADRAGRRACLRGARRAVSRARDVRRRAQVALSVASRKWTRQPDRSQLANGRSALIR